MAMRRLLTTSLCATKSYHAASRSVPRTVAPIISSLPTRTGSSTFARNPLLRGLSTSAPQQRRYERFDGPYSNGGQPSSGNNLINNLKRRAGGDRGLVIYGVVIGGSVLYYVFHLERVPETGRLRFMDVSREQEKEVGMETYNETMAEFRGKILPANLPVCKRIRRVANRIIEANDLGHTKDGHALGAVEGGVPSWGAIGDILGDTMRGSGDAPNAGSEWEVYVVDDPKTKNAFVIPGGKIFVFTGILPVSANDDGLATVLGHEIAHVVARHGAERMSYMKVLFGIGFLLESLGIDVGITRLLITFAMQLPQSRTNESEADTIGLRLMAKACFDPAEAPKMWERMSQEDGGSRLDFMSTHPANSKRIKALEKQQPEVRQIRDDKCSNTGSHVGSFNDAYSQATGRMRGETVWT